MKRIALLLIAFAMVATGIAPVAQRTGHAYQGVVRLHPLYALIPKTTSKLKT